MKKVGLHKLSKELDNKGFSLVELLISIAVLVIIMVPLMGNFIRSMQLNNKAEKLQLQSNLAASILESLKANRLEDIVKDFNGQVGDFNYIPNAVTDVLQLSKTGEGMFEEIYSEEEQATYYFAIHGIKAGGSAYDAFITMKAAPYQIDNPSGGGIMNKFPMPKVINLDEKANGLLFSQGAETADSMDSKALDTYVSWGTAYAQTQLEQSTEYRDYLKAQSDYESRRLEGSLIPGEVPPTKPTLSGLSMDHSLRVYFTPREITKLVTKTMTAILNKDVLDYVITYICTWPMGSNIEDTISYPVSSKHYAKALENIYLFYTPSIFNSSRVSILGPSDRVIIENTFGNKISFFIAMQNNASMSNPLEVVGNDENISIFTDVPSIVSTETINPEIIETKPENRLFDITVQICNYVNDPEVNNHYKTVLYSLDSSKEK